MNLQSLNFYLGSTRKFKNRKRAHLFELGKNKHHSSILQNVYNKIGKKNIEFLIIDSCETKYLLDLEQLYLDNLNPKYNISKNAFAPMTGRKHSLKTKELFKKRFVPKGPEHHMYGKTWSDSQRAKLMKKMIGSKRTLETRKKMSEVAKRINSISRIDREKTRKKIVDNLGNKFNSLTDAGKFHNLSIATICDILKGRTIASKKNVQFKYANESKKFKFVENYKNRMVNGALKRSKLDKDDIIFIRELRKSMSVKEIMQIFPLSKNGILRIINKENWKNI